MICYYLNVHFQGQRFNILNLPYLKLETANSSQRKARRQSAVAGEMEYKHKSV